MRRNGFSMIELVFVIVVLGILSAIAVPRFILSREDACYSKMRADLSETQAMLSREYTKYFLQGKSLPKTDLEDILEILRTNGSENGKCNFKNYVVSVNNGVISGTMDAVAGSKTITMYIDNENNKNTTSSTSTAGVSRMPVIYCDLSDETCQKITGKIKQ